MIYLVSGLREINQKKELRTAVRNIEGAVDTAGRAWIAVE
jgi:hypothetical protein